MTKDNTDAVVGGPLALESESRAQYVLVNMICVLRRFSTVFCRFSYSCRTCAAVLCIVCRTVTDTVCL